MVEKFLKAKHWQLFVLMIGVPIIAQIIYVVWMIGSMNTESNEVPFSSFSFMVLFPIVIIIYAFVHFGWYYSIAIGLQKLVPEDVTMKVKKFKIFFIIPMVYILLLSLLIASTFLGLRFENSANEGTIVGAIGVMVIIVPLHLFSMFCIFYSLYFVAKTFKTVQLQRAVNFGDFAGEFFLLWFYFVGVWIIQPKINKMINESKLT